MDSFFKLLKKNLRGDVHHDALTRKIYSVDASIFEVEPLGIVCPKDQGDLQFTLQTAAEFNIPVIPRGAATGITGGCLGQGLVIDTSKYLNHILDIDIPNETALIQPGVVQDRLNEQLAPFGYRLGPDTSTGNRATIGGMLANNSAGARSLHYGKMSDHILEVELSLAAGESFWCQPLDQAQVKDKCLHYSQEGIIYREIVNVLEKNSAAIEKHFPKIPRRVSGYNLDILLGAKKLNLSQLIAGSEGTLGLATLIRTKIAKKPKHTGLCIIHVHDMIEAMQAIPDLLKFKLMSLEMIDDKILNTGRNSPAVKNKMEWLKGNPQAIFVAEVSGETSMEIQSQLEALAHFVSKQKIGYECVLLTDIDTMNHVWEVRKAGLGLLLSKRSYTRAIAFIEDVSVAPEQLSTFMHEFSNYLKSIGKEAGIYGHIGSGCMHIRPYMDLRNEHDLVDMQKIMQDVTAMLLRHQGTLSGEHGDGLIRSWLNQKLFGPEIYQAFCDVKKAFDPRNLMNPGKIVHADQMSSDLRIGPNTPQITIPTFLNFTQEGGIELAADLCNGNGQCRKQENVMCPSFQASGDEFHTTRARAQALRSIIHGRLPLTEFTDKSMYAVLDLCIECKGCKRECPSQVDMAKMKAEFLYQYQEKHGYSFRSYLFGYIHKWNRMSSPFANFFNAAANSSFSKFILKQVGITPKRSLPTLASERFSTWFHKQKMSNGKSIVLFNDTYTEFNQPEVGKAAFHLLSKLGYKIILANQHCCGRPLISKGLLRQAQNNAKNVIKTLYPYVQAGLDIIFLEPSCSSALRDDFKGLVEENSEKQKQLMQIIPQCFDLEVFLDSLLSKGPLPLYFKSTLKKVYLHGHCHQKALTGTQPALNVLKSISAFEVEEIRSGCCGMAGSFGYEEEHYDFSMKIGELHLLPAVRKMQADAVVVASGFSCRSQIQHGTGKKALHFAEVLYLQLIE